MQKNFLSWRRAPCGSICEILLPVILMLLIVSSREGAGNISVDNYTLYSLRHPLYPIAKLDENTDTFRVSAADQTEQIRDYTPFMNYSDYINFNKTLKFPIVTSQLIETVQTEISETANLEQGGETAALVNSTVENVQTAIQDLAIVTDEALTEIADRIKELPFADISRLIDWSALEQLIADFGLEEFVDVAEIQAVIEIVEEVIEDPQAALNDAIGFNITEVVTFLAGKQEIIMIEMELQYYIPALDPLGPYALYPDHCFPKTGK
jgi:hypothetical protein